MGIWEDRTQSGHRRIASQNWLHLSDSRPNSLAVLPSRVPPQERKGTHAMAVPAGAHDTCFIFLSGTHMAHVGAVWESSSFSFSEQNYFWRTKHSKCQLIQVDIKREPLLHLQYEMGAKKNLLHPGNQHRIDFHQLLTYFLLKIQWNHSIEEGRLLARHS